MKSHVVTYLLLIVAAFAFAVHFFLCEDVKVYCDIAAFALPTIATIVEIYMSERTRKKMKEEIDKRVIVEPLTQEEYDRRAAEGKVNENIYYLPTEE